jgi:hypothetical protein
MKKNLPARELTVASAGVRAAAERPTVRSV